jgi:transcriptional regulator with XRE-family HTH domain
MSTKDDNLNALEATKSIWDEMTFGGLVRSLRLSDEISQVDLAKSIGVSKQFLSDVEHNRKDVGIPFAKKTADALGYSIEPLIELLIRDQLRKQHLNYIVVLKKLDFGQTEI